MHVAGNAVYLQRSSGISLWQALTRRREEIVWWHSLQGGVDVQFYWNGLAQHADGELSGALVTAIHAWGLSTSS